MRRRRGLRCLILGDYVYAIGTRTYGAGVWTDVPDTADCPANFGNNDISSATTAP